MEFDDPELRRHYERVVSIMTSLPVELRPVCALLDIYGWYLLVEGEQSGRIVEVLRRLSDPELRISLKRWFSEYAGNSPSALSLRSTLERMIGETLPTPRGQKPESDLK